ncbi:hypothetical protein [Streptomyces sp. WAC 06725]|uniref:hypothetical protein n=1 Tax=Streptomyces sp. WAC 06725 TaxID=2203209 RepID=UPI0021AD903C|nr:hypothetical protein [Streptomyces sp. WAC 06725]
MITFEGWGTLGRPASLRPLVDKVAAYDDWDAPKDGAREQAIVAEAERLLAGPWPPPD